MKIKRLQMEFGPAWEEAQPVRITHGDASILIYLRNGTELVVETERADWKVQSAFGGSDCKLILQG